MKIDHSNFPMTIGEKNERQLKSHLIFLSIRYVPDLTWNYKYLVSVLNRVQGRVYNRDFVILEMQNKQVDKPHI